MPKQADRKKAIKDMIRRLHAGEDPDRLKGEFKDALEGLDEEDIVRIEEELIKDGMPPEEVQKLCSIHIKVFEESMQKDKALAPPGHPIHTLMEEHEILTAFADKLAALAQTLKGKKDMMSSKDEMEMLLDIIEHLKESEKHYLREENVLFPYLEKHGVTQPPKIMWSEHMKIREKEKALYDLYERREGFGFQDFAEKLGVIAGHLDEMLPDHFFKENNILFPTAIKVMATEEWKEVTKGFDGIGYCCFTPGSAKGHEATTESPNVMTGDIRLETGSFTKEELEAFLDTLPVDVTFVDAEDSVRYFSQSKDRIFVRTKAIIGRKVQNCHPQRSLHIVNKIVEDFKHGRRDVAEFWIDMKERLIHIRYFPIRKDGRYLGTLEVTQDVTGIRKLKGQKRLLD